MSDSEWLTAAYHIIEEAENPFVPQNTYDTKFVKMMEAIRKTSSADILSSIKKQLEKLKQRSQTDYDNFVQYFKKFPLWGTLDPEAGDFDTLQKRADVLKRHSYDFMWLYRRLEDYLSKRTLYAVLFNWFAFVFNELAVIKSIFPDYWEPDIFPDNRGGVLVDAGAYIGDSILSFIDFYGKDYKKIYAYEISEESCNKMQEILKDLPNIEIRCKGVGKEFGEFYLDVSSSDASANQLSDKQKGQRVEVVPLDEDIPEGFSFLKMDIEGAEFDALLGCERTIRERSPRLAVCVYHGYDDIHRIPALIDSINPSYRFYLRHNGGNLVPTEFVLLCKPIKEKAL